jgi:hypothetical protein
MNAAKSIEDGTALYRKATKEGVAPVLRKKYLMESIQHYNFALDSTLSIQDRVSIIRNIGMANLKLCEAFKEDDLLQRKFYTVEAVTHLSKAMQLGTLDDLKSGLRTSGIIYCKVLME